jgi:hypothetical protein
MFALKEILLMGRIFQKVRETDKNENKEYSTINFIFFMTLINITKIITFGYNTDCTMNEIYSFEIFYP